MNRHEIRGELKDAIAYNTAYAPDYPDEDGTNLGSELDSILAILAQLRASARAPYKIQQLDFAKQEIEEAFSLYRAGQDGSKRLEEALHLINRARASRPPKTDFVVGSDGIAGPAES
jgi:hypothetical protein